MRAAVVVQGRVATVYLPKNPNRIRSVFEYRWVKQPDGFYRGKATFEGRRWHVDIGKAVNPAKEADRLRRLGAQSRPAARTRSPGIQGFLQMERAAQGAQQITKATTQDLAEIFQALADGETP